MFLHNNSNVFTDQHKNQFLPKNSWTPFYSRGAKFIFTYSCCRAQSHSGAHFCVAWIETNRIWCWFTKKKIMKGWPPDKLGYMPGVWMVVGIRSMEFGHTSVRKALALNRSTSSIHKTEVLIACKVSIKGNGIWPVMVCYVTLN